MGRITQADCCPLFSVQPFTDVIAYHTSHNRNKKGNYVLHCSTSSLLERVNSNSIISYITLSAYSLQFPRAIFPYDFHIIPCMLRQIPPLWIGSNGCCDNGAFSYGQAEGGMAAMGCGHMIVAFRRKCTKHFCQ